MGPMGPVASPMHTHNMAGDVAPYDWDGLDPNIVFSGPALDSKERSASVGVPRCYILRLTT